MDILIGIASFLVGVAIGIALAKAIAAFRLRKFIEEVEAEEYETNDVVVTMNIFPAHSQNDTDEDEEITPKETIVYDSLAQEYDKNKEKTR